MRVPLSAILIMAAGAAGAVLSAACGGDGGGDGGSEGGMGPSLAMSIAIHGVVRSEADSTPVAGAVLRAYRIMAASSPDIELASVTTASNGAYSISFSAQCESSAFMLPYALKLDYPHHHVTSSTCPIRSCTLWPLPREACARGDWPLDIWVRLGY